MVKLYPLLFICFFSLHTLGQDFKGQWKGQFADQSVSFAGWGGNTCDYVLELETRGNLVSGYSYTYFTEGGMRFYTICKLKGNINRLEKTIEVTEIERTKTNVPVNISNCFQVHVLTYHLSDGVETLQGKWTPAPGQNKNCGFGFTSLERRKLVRTLPNYNATNRAKALQTQPTSPIAKATVPRVNQELPKKEKPNPKKVESPTDEPQVVMRRNNNHDITISGNKPETEIPTVAAPPGVQFEKRTANLIKTINTANPTVKISLYDNGTIDGDSVSLFYNDQLIVARKKLTAEPITLEIPVIAGKVNELVMYADNLGTIPPNTALLVVYDGNKRYEARITSDLEKSGTIRFIYQP